MPGLSDDPEKRANQLANLKKDAGPGRPKGSKNWSTVVRELLDDEELFEQLLDSMERKPAWLKTTNTKTLMQAITIAQSLKALSGSHFSAEWVRKTGFGDKIDITSNGETIKVEPVVISNIKPRNAIEGEVVENKQIDEPTTSAETEASS
jgi:hypothetical protein